MHELGGPLMALVKGPPQPGNSREGVVVMRLKCSKGAKGGIPLGTLRLGVSSACRKSEKGSVNPPTFPWGSAGNPRAAQWSVCDGIERGGSREGP